MAPRDALVKFLSQPLDTRLTVAAILVLGDAEDLTFQLLLVGSYVLHGSDVVIDCGLSFCMKLVHERRDLRNL